MSTPPMAGRMRHTFGDSTPLSLFPSSRNTPANSGCDLSVVVTLNGASSGAFWMSFIVRPQAEASASTPAWSDAKRRSPPPPSTNCRTSDVSVCDTAPPVMTITSTSPKLRRPAIPYQRIGRSVRSVPCRADRERFEQRWILMSGRSTQHELVQEPYILPTGHCHDR